MFLGFYLSKKKGYQIDCSMSTSEPPRPSKRVNIQSTMERTAEFNPINLIVNEPMMDMIPHSVNYYTEKYLAAKAAVPQLQEEIEAVLADQEYWQDKRDLYEYAHNQSFGLYMLDSNERLDLLANKKESKLREMEEWDYYLRYAAEPV